MDQELKTYLERIERKISMLMQEKKKETWVKAPVITKLTGWDSNQMRYARNNNYVKYKKNGNCYSYDIESLHPVHLKQSA